MSEIDEMKNSMVAELATMLMEKDKKLNLDQALSLVINSDTYQKLLDDRTRRYFQSPRYVYSFLEHELKTGQVG